MIRGIELKLFLGNEVKIHGKHGVVQQKIVSKYNFKDEVKMKSFEEGNSEFFERQQGRRHQNV